MSRALATISGNLTRDVELKFVGNGTALANLTVASEYRFKKGEDWEGQTSFFDVVVWGAQAEEVAAALASGGKGVPVVVSGRLEQQTWEDKEGGKRSKIVLVADEVAIQARGIETFERKQRTEGQQSKPQNRGGNGRTAGSSRQQYEDEEPF